MQFRKFLIISTVAAIVVFLSMLLMVSLPAALVVLLGLIVGISVFFNPFTGLVIYVVLLYVRPQDFIPSLAPMRIMLSMAVVVIGFFLVHKVFNREKIGIFATRQQVLMFILLLIIPISDLSNFRLGGAWKSFNDFLTVYLAFAIIVMITGKRYAVLYWSIIFASLFMALNGLMQHFNGADLFGQVPMNGRIRWVGNFGDPNDFALVLVTAMPILIFHIFERRLGVLKRLGLLAMLAVFVVSVYYTSSRGGYLALLAVIAGFSFKKWGIIRGAFITAVLIALGLFAAPDRMSSTSIYGASESGRIYAWVAGLVMLKSHPILGVGMHRFTEFHVRAAHSAYIKCMAELGIAGYFVWLALIYTSFRDLIKIEKISSDSNVILFSRITQVAMIGFLVSAFFLSQTYNPTIYILFAIAALFSMQLREEYGINFPILSGKEILMVIAIEGFSILLFKVLSIVY